MSYTTLPHCIHRSRGGHHAENDMDDAIKFEISVLGARLVGIPDRALSRDELRDLTRRAESARSRVWAMRRAQAPRILRARADASERDVSEALANDRDGVLAPMTVDMPFQWPMNLAAYDWLAEHPGHPFEIVEVSS